MYITALYHWTSVVLEVIALGKLLYEEQARYGFYQGTYSEEVFKEHLSNYVFHPETIVLLLHNDDDSVIGFALMSKSRDLCIEYYGMLEAFYIHPDYRRTKAAIILRDAAVQWFDDQECVYSIAADQAYIGRGRAYTNLLLKVGYEEIGSTLIRRNYEKNKEMDQERGPVPRRGSNEQGVV